MSPSVPADAMLVGFTRALRAAGLPVTQDRTQTYLEAVAAVGLGDQQATYWAGRATLCAGPEDLVPYDRVFTAWFLEEGRPRAGNGRPTIAVVQAALDQDEGGDAEGGDSRALAVAASEQETLRHRDIADLSPGERAELAGMFATLRPRAPLRTAYRSAPFRRGSLDTRTTLRRTLSRMGEPDLAWQRRSVRPRRVVLLVDVSGSMGPYADSLLRLAHRVATATAGGEGAPPRAAGRRVPQGRPVEVFTLGTRVTRVTRAMRARDPERALAAAGDTVPDWSGGTRLGETLGAFLDRWGQRGMARGAVVVLFSDGWERGDAQLLGAQMRRLHRLAHRVVWVNPHKGQAGYRPVQSGMAAALPSVDHFVAGHSLAAFAELMEVVARA